MAHSSYGANMKKERKERKKQVKLICLFIQLLLYFQEIH